MDPHEALSIGFTEEEIRTTQFYEAVGCGSCNAGYKGRIAVHESLYFSRAVRRAIFESGGDINEELIRQIAISEGMLTLRASGRERIKEGISSITEVAASTTTDD
jgi:type IV pilus assembly protein PilB